MGISPVDRAKIHGVMFQFLSDADAERATAVLQKLQRHDIHEWALTGGLAVELHAALGGSPAATRFLNDIDFVVPRFDCIPESIGSEFLCRHIHPLDPPGKTIAQFVDPQEKVRVDVFRAFENLFTRTVQVDLHVGVCDLSRLKT